MKKSFLSLIVSAGFIAALTSHVVAAPLYWGGGTTDIANATPVAGGNGDWTPTTANWSTDASGTTYQAWAADSIANFTVNAGTISLSSGIPSVGGMNFTISSATWNFGGNNRFTFTNGAVIDTGNNTVNFNGASLSGSSNITKDGSGTFILWSDDDAGDPYTGTISHNGGVLQLRGSNVAGRASAINITGGTLVQLINSADTTYGSTTPLAVTIASSGSSVEFNNYNTGGSLGVTSTFGALSLGARTVNFRQTFYSTSGYAFGSTTLTGAATLDVDSGMGVTLGATSGAFGITKTGAGTLTLTGNSTYTGDTTVSAGTFNLASGAQMEFTIGLDDINNQINGAGASILDGSFAFDLSGAGTTLGDSWSIVSTTTKTFNSSFAVVDGFTDNLDSTWSKVNGESPTPSRKEPAISSSQQCQNQAQLFSQGWR